MSEPMTEERLAGTIDIQSWVGFVGHAGERGITIRLHDESTRKVLVEIEISQSQFAEAMFGHGDRPATYQLFALSSLDEIDRLRAEVERLTPPDDILDDADNCLAANYQDENDVLTEVLAWVSGLRVEASHDL